MRKGMFWITGLLAATVSMTAAATDPVEAIRTKDVELQKLLRTKDAPGKIDRLKILINGIFDFEELGKRALGPATWGKMTPKQQTRFVQAFRSMIENSSVKRLDAYLNDSTRYEAPETEGEKSSVTAHVFSKGSQSVVVYKLLMKQGAWKAWDLVIDDLSTAGNYGDQFKKILAKNTVDALITKVEQKAKGDASSKTADNVKSRSGGQTAA
ncbi:MAG TPA: hypothetical protein DCQ83_09395, partial [Fibrobacteres bacterium]|nr:hypothetical protein [Fibrobacterota bacterium]